MKCYQAELQLAKSVVGESLAELMRVRPELASFDYVDNLPREMKAAIDRVLEDIILKRLMPTGIGVLSEEAGIVGEYNAGDLRWVVDPLDGTVNFIRGLAPCAVSISLWHGESPVLGVIGEFPSGKVAWGGPDLGVFLNQQPLRVSALADKEKAVLCTGFPARFDFSGPGMVKFSKRAGSFGKIRMLGAASLSLLQVAKGAAEAYAEQDIMLWDVAAGLALVQGAGGCVFMQAGHFAYSLNVFASNGHIND